MSRWLGRAMLFSRAAALAMARAGVLRAETFGFRHASGRCAVLSAGPARGARARFTLPGRALARAEEPAVPGLGHAAAAIASPTLGIEGPGERARCGDGRQRIGDVAEPFRPRGAGIERAAHGAGRLEPVSAWRHRVGRQLQFMLLRNPGCCWLTLTAILADGGFDARLRVSQPFVAALCAANLELFGEGGLASKIARADPALPPGQPSAETRQEEVSGTEARAARAPDVPARVARRTSGGPSCTGCRRPGSTRGSAAHEAAPAPGAASGSAAGAASRAPDVPDNLLVFDLENASGRQLRIGVREQRTRGRHSPCGHVRPRTAKVWPLPPGVRQEYPLTFRLGAGVCLGAEFDADPKRVSGVFRGASLDGPVACDACGLVCGGTRTARRPTWDGKRCPPSAQRRGGGGQVAADLPGAIVTGIAIGTALSPRPASGGGSGGGTAPDRPVPRPSDIPGPD